MRVFWQKYRAKLLFFTFDVLAIPLAWLLVYWFKYTWTGIAAHILTPDAWLTLGVLMLTQVSCYFAFNVYRGLWRFSSLSDVVRIVQATFAAVVLAVPLLYVLQVFSVVPRRVLPLYGLILTALLCAARLGLRYYADRRARAFIAPEVIQRVLIVGAGQAGAGLVRDLKRTRAYVPVGFVDDDPVKLGVDLHGVRVLGALPQLVDLVRLHQIDLLFIAIPSAGSADMRRIVSYCEQSGCLFHTLPSIQALASGQVTVSALRRVNIDDLLGRDQVELRWDKIALAIQARVIVVTGAGGSIGSELCRQIMGLQPQKMVLIDQCEYNLYQIEQDLSQQFPQIPIVPALVNVVDAVAMFEVMQREKPAVVFHAAAYKHVPMLEQQMRAAVCNNILGTQVVAEASVAAGVEKFVLISSDKAVNPTNIMGMTKRVAEIYCQNLNARVATQFITVRFGNVLGSVGSVLPLFQKQLEAGGPLTVTHPDIERYFMTILEASQLILQAMVNGGGGEIFVLDMGEPIQITYLAEQMIRLAGKIPGKDIAIQYIGLRPGEKLFEELFHPSEQLVATEHDKLFKARFRPIDWDDLMQTMRMISRACELNQVLELLVLLKSLVPEFNQSIESESLGLYQNQSA